MPIAGTLLSRYDIRVFELASRIVLDWDIMASFYAASRLETCLKSGDHRHALVWLDVIRAVEAMSDSQSLYRH